MKKPRIAFNKDSILAFLVNNGEKVVVALVALFACAIAFGGVNALCTMRPQEKELPDYISTEAARVEKGIEEVKQVPEKELLGEQGLAAKVAPWLSVKVDPLPQPLILDKPLFAELSKRTSPDILPIEDLRAIAGVAVIAAKPAPAGGRQAAADKPTELDATAAKPQKPARGVRGPQAGMGPMQPGMAGSPPMAGEMSGMPGPSGMPGAPDQGMGQPKLVPYVVVTGLIPVKKQLEEYDRRFLGASLHDPNIDTPRWNTYRIEKTEVIPGTAEKWVPVDIKAVAKQYSAQWLRLHLEPAIGPLTLSADLELREKNVTPIPFCSPLPQLADGTWGFKGLHPWFVDMLLRDAAARKAKEAAAREASPEDVFGGSAQPGFPMMTDPAMMGSGAMSGSSPVMPEMGMGSGGQRHVIDGVEYRLFRFIDLAVVPGRKYRYRVRVVCWNPNLNLPTRHLADVALAKKTTLESPPSEATPPALVPDGKQLLVQPLKKDVIKKLKPGMVQIMALGEKPRSGTFALRGLIMEVGAMANVDPKSNKKGDPRSVGDELTTDRVLIDSRGDRQDRSEAILSGKPSPPPEPLEMIFLRPDGTFEVASAAESQPQIDHYRQTAPPELGGPAPMPVQQGPGAASPFGNPFAPSPAGQSR